MSATTRRPFGKIPPCIREDGGLCRLGKVRFSELIRSDTLSGKALASASDIITTSPRAFPFDIAAGSVKLNEASRAVFVRPNMGAQRQVDTVMRDVGRGEGTVACTNPAWRTALHHAALKVECRAGASGCLIGALSAAAAAQTLAKPSTPSEEAHELAAVATDRKAFSFNAQPTLHSWSLRGCSTMLLAEGARARIAWGALRVPPSSSYDPDIDTTEWPDNRTGCMSSLRNVVMATVGNPGTAEGKSSFDGVARRGPTPGRASRWQRVRHLRPRAARQRVAPYLGPAPERAPRATRQDAGKALIVEMHRIVGEHARRRTGIGGRLRHPATSVHKGHPHVHCSQSRPSQAC